MATAGEGQELLDRVGNQTSLRLTAANLVGGAFAIAGAAMTNVSTNGAPVGFDLLGVSMVAAYAVGATMVGVLWGTQSYERALGWLRDDRPPTPDERRMTMGQPWRLAGQGLLLWLGAALAFGLLDVFHYRSGSAFAIRESFSRVLGGLAVAALTATGCRHGPERRRTRSGRDSWRESPPVAVVGPGCRRVPDHDRADLLRPAPQTAAERGGHLGHR
jgi:hypothetical protein